MSEAEILQAAAEAEKAHAAELAHSRSLSEAEIVQAAEEAERAHEAQVQQNMDVPTAEQVNVHGDQGDANDANGKRGSQAITSVVTNNMIAFMIRIHFRAFVSFSCH